MWLRWGPRRPRLRRGADRAPRAGWGWPAVGARALRPPRPARERARRDAEALAGQLEALSPVRTMQRGYSLVCGPDGALVTSARDLQPGDALTVRTLDGRADAVVTGTREIPLPGGNGTEREEQRDAAAAYV